MGRLWVWVGRGCRWEGGGGGDPADGARDYAGFEGVEGEVVGGLAGLVEHCVVFGFRVVMVCWGFGGKLGFVVG